VRVPSLHSLTNVFKHYGKPITFLVERVENGEYAIICRYAHPGIRTFEVYCYEKIEDEGWYLRNVELLHFSDSMTVSIAATNGTITIIHDGNPVCSLFPSVEQQMRQRQSRMVRGDTSRPDTNEYIYPQ